MSRASLFRRAGARLLPVARSATRTRGFRAAGTGLGLGVAAGAVGAGGAFGISRLGGALAGATEEIGNVPGKVLEETADNTASAIDSLATPLLLAGAGFLIYKAVQK